MTRKLLQMFGAGLLGAALLVGGGEAAQGQQYWRTYRYPYYGSYQPYYVAPRAYSTYYAPPTYYRSYSVQPYYNDYGPVYRSYYAPSSYGTYYGAPNAGYYESPYGAGVQVGRLRIGW